MKDSFIGPSAGKEVIIKLLNTSRNPWTGVEYEHDGFRGETDANGILRAKINGGPVMLGGHDIRRKVEGKAMVILQHDTWNSSLKVVIPEEK